MPRPLLLTAAVLAAYLLLVFGSVPGNPVLGFPVHHDDFRNLSWIHPTLPEPARPVSGFLLTVFSSLGIPAYYLALHALAVLYTTLTLAALLRLLETRSTPGALLLPVAVAMLSAECMVEFSKYTGLVTGLLSGTFGAAAIALLLGESRRPIPRAPCLTAALAFAALSGFSKEDFLLPLLAAAALAAWEHRNAGAARTWIAVLAAVSLLTAAVFAYNRAAGSAYTSGASFFYKQDFSPASIAATAWKYIELSRGAAIALALQAASLILNAIARNPIPWPRMLALQAIACSLALPYLCLPNHITPYYAFHWTPWQFGGALLAIWQSWPGRPAAVAIVAIALVCAAATQAGRSGVVNWYRAMETVNRNAIQTLEANRLLLAPHREVAIEGPPMLGPWFGSNGDFLANRYGFAHRWLIRVPRDGEFARQFHALTGSLEMGRNKVVPLEDPAPPGVPTIKLGPDGRGIAVPARPDQRQ